MEPPYPPSYGLNSTTTIFLGEWLWHYITYKGWYAIKKRNQPYSSTRMALTLNYDMPLNKETKPHLFLVTFYLVLGTFYTLSFTALLFIFIHSLSMTKLLREKSYKISFEWISCFTYRLFFIFTIQYNFDTKFSVISIFFYLFVY